MPEAPMFEPTGSQETEGPVREFKPDFLDVYIGQIALRIVRHTSNLDQCYGGIPRDAMPTLPDADIDHLIERGQLARRAFALEYDYLLVDEIRNIAGEGFEHGPLLAVAERGMAEALDTYNPHQSAFDEHVSGTLKLCLHEALRNDFGLSEEQIKIILINATGRPISQIAHEAGRVPTGYYMYRRRAREVLGFQKPGPEGLTDLEVKLLDMKLSGASPEEILERMRSSRHKGQWNTLSVVRQLAEVDRKVEAAGGDTDMARLTAFQRQLVPYLKQGMGLKAIARELDLSVETVWRHKEVINAKLGTNWGSKRKTTQSKSSRLPRK